MKFSTRFLKALLVLALCCGAETLTAQTTREFAVLLRADISKAPALTVLWERDETAIAYKVSRRMKTAEPWVFMRNLGGADTSFTDTTALPGTAYEYQVLKTGRKGVEIYFASGYIYTGAGVYPAQEDARKILLIIDEALQLPLAAEIDRYKLDLKKEGWQIVESYVARSDTFYAPRVASVKKLISDEYKKDPKLLKSVVLIGRVAVPYSGDIFPDGHQPDHRGAWPADGYYGDMNENLWTDATVNNSGASRDETKNIPGDGKFDQDDFPSQLEVAVGRIDLSDMPDFKKSELELLKAYFRRNHDFRTAKLNIPQRGLIDDNFGAFINRSQPNAPDTTRYIESFASTAWRSWSPLIGVENIVEGDYLGTLDTAAYLWAYGCGGGGYQAAGGIGVTSNFADSSANTIFSGLFGSYFGDWDVENSLLRAPLCSSPGALTSVWAGRPHWFFHRMGLGESIGQATLLSQNNFGEDNGRNYLSTSYFSSKSFPSGAWYSNNSQGVHIALMGDPTLVMQPVARDVDFLSSQISTDTNTAFLSWQVLNSDSSAIGYLVYRAFDPSGPFTLLTKDALDTTSYTDSTARNGFNYYMVQAVQLQSTPGGSYFVKLATSATLSIDVYNSIISETDAFKNIALQPNPARDFAEISFKSTGFEKGEVTVLDVAGREVLKLYAGIFESDSRFMWDLTDGSGSRVPAGVYIVKITSGQDATIRKVVIMP